MNASSRLKRNDLPALRSELHKAQGRSCALCGHKIRVADVVLDHDHKSGHVRGVLHRDCNVLLGKIENYVTRHGRRIADEGRLADALSGIMAYREDNYSDMPLHPTHLTADDKEARRLRRLIKRSKKPETKQKWRDALKEFNDARSE